MAGEPAIRKIVDALAATLGAIPGLRVDIDRAEDEPYGNAELPAANIVVAGVAFEARDHGTTLHRASVDIDLHVDPEAGSTNAARLDAIEADAVATLHADRTLGGRAEDVAPLSSGGADGLRADTAVRTLSIEIRFLTPLGDHRTLMGATGPIP